MVKVIKSVNLICLIIAIVGVILVLYGANITLYNEVNSYTRAAGWVGTYLFIGSVVFVIVFNVYKIVTKTGTKTETEQQAQKP
jgi:hypothetical protein